jgi:hypothetical protein
MPRQQTLKGSAIAPLNAGTHHTHSKEQKHGSSCQIDQKFKDCHCKPFLNCLPMPSGLNRGLEPKISGEGNFRLARQDMQNHHEVDENITRYSDREKKKCTQCIY